MEKDALTPMPPTEKELREAYRTMTGLPSTTDNLASRLELVEALMTNAQSLPAAPILVWREPEKPVAHRVLELELIVGRETGNTGLSFSGDQLLSRRHFAIRNKDAEWILEDLQSRNGTAINRTENKVKSEALRDGDLIFAGNQVFVFLDQGRVT
jgi:hypothetical protein